MIDVILTQRAKQHSYVLGSHLQKHLPGGTVEEVEAAIRIIQAALAKVDRAIPCPLGGLGGPSNSSSRVNLFIADDAGLGKTMEAGLIARELLLRKKVREVVVSCPPSTLVQWSWESFKLASK